VRLPIVSIPAPAATFHRPIWQRCRYLCHRRIRIGTSQCRSACVEDIHAEASIEPVTRQPGVVLVIRARDDALSIVGNRGRVDHVIVATTRLGGFAQRLSGELFRPFQQHGGPLFSAAEGLRRTVTLPQP
jgi:hypothetical protein